MIAITGDTETQCILITVIIDIHNSIAFRFNFHILVIFLEMETSVSFGGTIHNGICVIACTC